MGRLTKAQLEQWNEELKAENASLHRQMTDRLEESDDYKLLAKQFQQEVQLKNRAIDTLTWYRDKYKALENERDHWMESQEQAQDIVRLRQEYDDLKASYDALIKERDALTDSLDAAQAELQKFKAEKPHNERGAGRKPVLTDVQRDEVCRLHAQGKSLRQIATQMGVTHTAIAKIIKGVI